MRQRDPRMPEQRWRGKNRRISKESPGKARRGGRPYDTFSPIDVGADSYSDDAEAEARCRKTKYAASRKTTESGNTERLGKWSPGSSAVISKLVQRSLTSLTSPRPRASQLNPSKSSSPMSQFLMSPFSNVSQGIRAPSSPIRRKVTSPQQSVKGHVAMDQETSIEDEQENIWEAMSVKPLRC